MAQLLIGVDIGTMGVKAVLYTSRGRAVGPCFPPVQAVPARYGDCGRGSGVSGGVGVPDHSRMYAGGKGECGGCCGSSFRRSDGWDYRRGGAMDARSLLTIRGSTNGALPKLNEWNAKRVMRFLAKTRLSSEFQPRSEDFTLARGIQRSLPEDSCVRAAGGLRGDASVRAKRQSSVY